MSKIVRYSFTVSAKKDSAFGCMNYLYWISYLAVFQGKPGKNGFIHDSVTRNRNNC